MRAIGLVATVVVSACTAVDGTPATNRLDTDADAPTYSCDASIPTNATFALSERNADPPRLLLPQLPGWAAEHDEHSVIYREDVTGTRWAGVRISATFGASTRGSADADLARLADTDRRLFADARIERSYHRVEVCDADASETKADFTEGMYSKQTVVEIVCDCGNPTPSTISVVALITGDTDIFDADVDMILRNMQVIGTS